MLTNEQTQFYQDNGFILVPGLFTREEAAVMRRETHEMLERVAQVRDTEATWGGAKKMAAGSTQTKIMHCHNVHYQSAVLGRMLFDERFTEAAAQIIGSLNVQLHHSKAFIKPPEKGSPFPMHQDYPYFPHEKHSMIAAIIHFDDAPLEKGCVRVVPGSHKLGPLQHESSGDHHLPFEQYPIEDAMPCPARAGDVLFFSYLTIHGSGINVSDEARTTVLVQMRDPEDMPLDDSAHVWKPGMMLRGIDPTGGRSWMARK